MVPMASIIDLEWFCMRVSGFSAWEGADRETGFAKEEILQCKRLA